MERAGLLCVVRWRFRSAEFGGAPPRVLRPGCSPSIKAPEYRGNLPQDRSQGMAVLAQESVDGFLFRGFRLEKNFHPFPVSEKAFAIGVTVIRPVAEEAISRPFLFPEESPVLKPGPIIGNEVGIEGFPPVRHIFQDFAHQSIRPRERAYSLWARSLGSLRCSFGTRRSREEGTITVRFP